MVKNTGAIVLATLVVVCVMLVFIIAVLSYDVKEEREEVNRLNNIIESQRMLEYIIMNLSVAMKLSNERLDFAMEKLTVSMITSNVKLDSAMDKLASVMNASNDKLALSMDGLNHNLHSTMNNLTLAMNTSNNKLALSLDTSNDKLDSAMNRLASSVNTSNDKLVSAVNASNEKLNIAMNKLASTMYNSNDKLAMSVTTSNRKLNSAVETSNDKLALAVKKSNDKLDLCTQKMNELENLTESYEKLARCTVPTWCPRSWKSYPCSQKCYLVLSCDGQCNRDRALAGCTRQNGTLATIISEHHNEFIKQELPGSYIWIGASDPTNTGRWVWMDGTPLTYANWAPGQPDTAGTEYCVLMGWPSIDHGEWNDYDCNLAPRSPTGYACQRSAILY